MDPAQTQPGTAPTGIVDQISQLAHAFADNLKTRFKSGPPAGALGADPGSVLGQRNAQLSTMSPQPSPQQSYTPQAQGNDTNPTLSHQQPPYGTNSPEQRLDNEGNVERMSPLGGGVNILQPMSSQPSGLKGVKRVSGPNGGI